MDSKASAIKNMFLGVMALLGWFALASQLYINLASGAAPIPELIVRYFSYFTLTTNLIVATCCTALIFKKSGFFCREGTQTAIAVYIIIVGLIYNLILRFIWKPEGLQMIVDELLHSVIPVMFLIYWLLFVKKHQLKWKDAFSWMIYPLAYTGFILIRGPVAGFYPYPFIDISRLGLQKVLVNAAGIAFLFMVISLLLIAIGKIRNKKDLVATGYTSADRS